ncbi:protein transport protein Sec31p [Trichomonascus vanleenenianus]|uniref:Sec31p n=1 Tax=Trichomonascus vanleenenianus TaxID=2268995 RepID=UPI003ECAD3AF
MVKLREINRSSAYSWSPVATGPSIVTGSYANGQSQLEFWDLNLVDRASKSYLLDTPSSSVSVDSSKINDIVWGGVSDARPSGVIATGHESGLVNAFDAHNPENRVLSLKKHSGAVRSLQFNPVQSHVLASAGANREVFVWDLKRGSAFAVPTERCRLDEIDAMSWNNKIAKVFAVAGNTGYTSVLELGSKDEKVLQFKYANSTGGRCPVGSIAWHPTEAVKFAVSSRDENVPVILLWDLRNNSAPQQVLRGHKGDIASMDWCAQDANLLISTGMDNRTFLWNPERSVKVGEYPIESSWSFKTRFSPRVPDLFATASQEGTIAIQTLQDTHAKDNSNKPSFSLEFAPQWLRRPVSAQFAFGGKIVAVKTEGGRSSVEISSKHYGDDSINDEATQMSEILHSRDLSAIAKSRADNAKSKSEQFDWRVIAALMEDGDKRVRLAQFFETAQVPLEALQAPTPRPEEKKPEEPSVEQPKEEIKPEEKPEEPKEEVEKEEDVDTTASEHGSVTEVSKKKKKKNKKKKDQPEPEEPEKAETEETKEEDDLFGEGSGTGFLSSFSTSAATATEETANEVGFDEANGTDVGFLSSFKSTQESSFAPIGQFHLFTSGQSSAEQDLTRAVLLGQIERAVDICLEQGRIPDAFMLSANGSEELKAKVRNAYVATNAKTNAFVRLLNSVTSNNLNDLVNNADVTEWREVITGLFTYCKNDKSFATLSGQLGDRLLSAQREASDPTEKTELRNSAVFCYLAGSNLDKAVNLWLREVSYAELHGDLEDKSSSFPAHFKALHEFVEKVTMFRKAVGIKDAATSSDDTNLAGLYNAYRDYATVVGAQGHLDLAEAYLKLLPSDYPGVALEKERVHKAKARATTTTTKASHARTQSSGGLSSIYAAAAPRAAAPNPYIAPPAVLPPTVAKPVVPQQPVIPPVPQQPVLSPPANPYQPMGAPSVPTYAKPLSPAPPPPPPPAAGSRPPKEKGGWNDLPEHAITASRRATPAATAIRSPFPNQAPPVSQSPPLGPPKGGAVPPPKSSSPRVQSPRVTSPVLNNRYAPAQPTATISPPQNGGHYGTAPPPPNPYAQAQSQQNPYAQPPPQQSAVNPYGAAPMAQVASPPPSNPYAPPPGQQQQHGIPTPGNPYAPPPGQGPIAPGPPPAGAVFAPPPPPPGPGAGGFAAPPLAGQYQPGQAVKSATPEPEPIVEQITPQHPPGDRSHIPDKSRPIFEVLSAELDRVMPVIPQQYQRQMKDAERRLNMLYDHLNNEDLLSDETIEEMLRLVEAVSQQDYAMASALQVDIMTTRSEECGKWMIGVKRLIDTARAVFQQY